MESKARLELLKERIDNAIQDVCREFLEMEKIETGDIDPLRAVDVDRKQEALAETLNEWIDGRLQAKEDWKNGELD
jgi:hypothetical protein